MVSVIIPNYNRVEYLQESLQSLINQTFDAWEALVVDDGSEDHSKKTVESYQDKRIKWISRNRSPKGASTCRNIGIEKAQGSFVIFLDSDDLLAPHCLETRLMHFENNPNLDFLVFKMQFFHEKPGDDSRVWSLENGQSHFQRFLNLDSVWQTSGPIWKKESLLKIKGFDERLHCWQDVDIHLKAFFNDLDYKVFNDLEPDCFYRKNPLNSVSQSNTNSKEKLESKALLYRSTQKNINHQMFDINGMAFHILVSAIKSMNKIFFRNFLSSVENSLPKSTVRELKFLSELHFMRLTKFKFFNKMYLKRTSQLVPPNHIGKFTIDET